MKKIDLVSFVDNISQEIRDFEESQLAFNPMAKKTMHEWINHFMIHCGYEEKSEERIDIDEYENDIYYSDSYEYQELVNRRKYRSFRDDDRY